MTLVFGGGLSSGVTLHSPTMFGGYLARGLGEIEKCGIRLENSESDLWPEGHFLCQANASAKGG